MKGVFPIEKFKKTDTPFYYYDTDLLRETLNTINKEAGKYENFCVHYAIKYVRPDWELTVLVEVKY